MPDSLSLWERARVRVERAALRRAQQFDGHPLVERRAGGFVIAEHQALCYTLTRA